MSSAYVLARMKLGSPQGHHNGFVILKTRQNIFTTAVNVMAYLNTWQNICATIMCAPEAMFNGQTIYVGFY